MEFVTAAMWQRKSSVAIADTRQRLRQDSLGNVNRIGVLVGLVLGIIVLNIAPVALPPVAAYAQTAASIAVEGNRRALASASLTACATVLSGSRT